MVCIITIIAIEFNIVKEKVEPQPGDIGVMFQENALFDSMTARENISFQIINTLSYSKLKALGVANKLLNEILRCQKLRK